MSRSGTDLERFREHCRRMAEAGPGDFVMVSQGGGRRDLRMRGPMCSDTDRELWRRMGEEIDHYLTYSADDDPLF